MQKNIPSPRSVRPFAGAAALAAGICLASSAQAQITIATSRVYNEVAEVTATNTQFVTVSGAGTINPSGKAGSGFFSGLGETSSYEALPGYRTVQTFPTSLSNLNTAKGLNFTGEGSSDVYFSASASTGTSVATNATYVTSVGNGIRLQVIPSTAFTLTISFGDLAVNSEDPTQTFFSSTQGVSAVGFTLGGLYSRLLDTSATVSFFSSTNTLLNSQVLNGTVEGDAGSTSVSSANRWAFVGWQNSSGVVANNIDHLTISFTTWASTGDLQLALDDFGYTTSSLTSVPEPASAAVFAGLGSLGLIFGTRRRRR